MALNFRISTQVDRKDLHLKLEGDFDGSSAFELLNAIRDHRNKADHIVIHTSGLKTIYSFGPTVFKTGLCFQNGTIRTLVFTGSNKNKIDPRMN